MFTGIIEETGKLLGLEQSGTSAKIKIAASIVLDGTKIGDSIAVNGVCLTATDIAKNFFVADVMPETLRRSNLGALKNGDIVNLERAMPCDGRFGGHIVSGHIDGIGKISAIQNEANAIWFYVSAPDEILNLVVPKGSVALDGISLTVAKINSAQFAVSVIPHTQTQTNLLFKKIGDIVNIENDIIGKYVQKFFGQGDFSSINLRKKSEEKITEDFLRKNNF